MPSRPPARVRRWMASLIITVFFAAVTAAAAIGWWYARESPAHQGPIVLISVDGVPAAALPPYGAQRTDMPGIDSLAADAVVFDRAYAHSPQTLPAHASMLSGQLPLEHGVRDDAGFALGRDVSTLAEMLRSRGFSTGAAVSSFLLRPESGMAQGFGFFDAELPAGDLDAGPALGRNGAQTLDAAERWVEDQGDRRFFLFVQVGSADADAAVTRLASLLESRDFYDDATILLVGDRGDPTAGLALDDATLRVPLLVKQPEREGAGRRIALPVQHIDLVPTILDLVRAPIPGDLHGRSLRPVLDDDDAAEIADEPIYSEVLAARYRFGGDALLAMTGRAYRYVRGAEEDLVSLVPRAPDVAGSGEAAETGRLRRALDRLVAQDPAHEPEPIAEASEDRYALFGYLATPRLAGVPDSPLSGRDQAALAEEHRAAARLIGQKKYSAGIRALQKIVRDHPELAVVHYQLGVLLVRTGRTAEGIAALQIARELRPAAADLARALADALMRAGHHEAAQEEALEAIALARDTSASQRAAAFETAARVALASGDTEAAVAHADAAEAADPAVPVARYVRGRLLYDQGDYDQAAEVFSAAAATLRESERALPDLHLYLGESLAHLYRYEEAEASYRAELHAFPRNTQAYKSLAMLYRASNRDAALEDVLNELVSATPTPEGYAIAARLWTTLGDRSRAEALRSDAQTRFRDDPALALLAPDGRR